MLRMQKQIKRNKKVTIKFIFQVNAIRRGLEKVVPKAVLTLMTWQELEQRICGEPEITVEALKKSGKNFTLLYQIPCMIVASRGCQPCSNKLLLKIINTRFFRGGGVYSSQVTKFNKLR